ncbi:D-alanine--D-alanine ligase [Parabacteroides sp. OttesenSCG-928-N08]|nr:D-alanine--D-alanine ligase [Parabacteroides sp. OttesenSCG-928-N08]
MKRNIAVIAGGYSSEVEVSYKSAKGIQSFLNKEIYNVYIALLTREEWVILLADDRKATIDKNNFSFRDESGELVQIDFAYITIHGTPGEDGKLQGYFDMLQIPYSGCGVYAASLTFNKYACVHYLKGFGVKVSDSQLVKRGERINDEEVVNRLGLPLFVKPIDGGSSFGVTKVKRQEELQPAIEKAFSEGEEVMIERFIAGREVTCGTYRTKRGRVVLPLTEVVTPNEFFDYEAKYNGQSDEITPAPIPEAWAETIRQTTTMIYDLIGAKGLIRADYIVTPEGEPLLLEVNTTPGMTPASFIPQQVRAAGLQITEVLTEIIENEFFNQV